MSKTVEQQIDEALNNHNWGMALILILNSHDNALQSLDSSERFESSILAELNSRTLEEKKRLVETYGEFGIKLSIDDNGELSLGKTNWNQVKDYCDAITEGDHDEEHLMEEFDNICKNKGVGFSKFVCKLNYYCNSADLGTWARRIERAGFTGCDDNSDGDNDSFIYSVNGRAVSIEANNGNEDEVQRIYKEKVKKAEEEKKEEARREEEEKREKKRKSRPKKILAVALIAIILAAAAVFVMFQDSQKVESVSIDYEFGNSDVGYVQLGDEVILRSQTYPNKSMSDQVIWTVEGNADFTDNKNGSCTMKPNSVGSDIRVTVSYKNDPSVSKTYDFRCVTAIPSGLEIVSMNNPVYASNNTNSVSVFVDEEYSTDVYIDKWKITDQTSEDMVEVKGYGHRPADNGKTEYYFNYILTGNADIDDKIEFECVATNGFIEKTLSGAASVAGRTYTISFCDDDTGEVKHTTTVTETKKTKNNVTATLFFPIIYKDAEYGYTWKWVDGNGADFNTAQGTVKITNDLDLKYVKYAVENDVKNINVELKQSSDPTKGVLLDYTLDSNPMNRTVTVSVGDGAECKVIEGSNSVLIEPKNIIGRDHITATLALDCINGISKEFDIPVYSVTYESDNALVGDTGYYLKEMEVSKFPTVSKDEEYGYTWKWVDANTTDTTGTGQENIKVTKDTKIVYTKYRTEDVERIDVVLGQYSDPTKGVQLNWSFDKNISRKVSVSVNDSEVGYQFIEGENSVLITPKDISSSDSIKVRFTLDLNNEISKEFSIPVYSVTYKSDDTTIGDVGYYLKGMKVLIRGDEPYGDHDLIRWNASDFSISGNRTITPSEITYVINLTGSNANASDGDQVSVTSKYSKVIVNGGNAKRNLAIKIDARQSPITVTVNNAVLSSPTINGTYRPIISYDGTQAVNVKMNGSSFIGTGVNAISASIVNISGTSGESYCMVTFLDTDNSIVNTYVSKKGTYLSMPTKPSDKNGMSFVNWSSSSTSCTSTDAADPNGDGLSVVSGNATYYASRILTECKDYNKVYTATDLQNMSSNGSYVLMSDIDLSGTNWIVKDISKLVLNGNGHSIRNLCINTIVIDDGGKSGMYAKATDCTFSNIKFEGVNIEIISPSGTAKGSWLMVGTIAGRADNCKMYDISLSGISRVRADSDGDDDRMSISGGLIGKMCGGEAKNITSTLTVQNKGESAAFAGGLFGQLDGKVIIDNCSVNANVYNVDLNNIYSSIGTVSNYTYTGGIIGKIGTESSKCSGTISNLKYTGTIYIEGGRSSGHHCDTLIYGGKGSDVTVNLMSSTFNSSGASKVTNLGSSNGPKYFN